MVFDSLSKKVKKRMPLAKLQLPPITLSAPVCPPPFATLTQTACCFHCFAVRYVSINEASNGQGRGRKEKREKKKKEKNHMSSSLNLFCFSLSKQPTLNQWRACCLASLASYSFQLCVSYLFILLTLCFLLLVLIQS